MRFVRQWCTHGPLARRDVRIRATPVVECVFLLRAKDGLPEGAAETAVDHVWSLQYKAPHALCASGGKLQACVRGAGAGSGLCDFTHAVHVRFGSEAHLQRFVADEIYWPTALREGARAHNGAESACTD